MNAAGTFFLVVFILLVLGIGGWVGFTQYRARRLGLPPPSWKSYIPFLGTQEQSPYGAPQPRRGGVLGWIEDRVSALRSKKPGRTDRTAAGAYEQGRGNLEDEAWDSRVPGDQGYGHGGFYNETELEEGRGRGGGGAGGGLAPGGSGPYGRDTGYEGSGYQMNVARPLDDDDDDDDGYGEPRRGRSRSRDERGAEAGGNPFGAGAVRHNPFDDDAEADSMRGVSPRPMGLDTTAGTTGTTSAASGGGAQGKRQSLESPTDRRSVFRENM